MARGSSSSSTTTITTTTHHSSTHALSLLCCLLLLLIISSTSAVADDHQSNRDITTLPSTVLKAIKTIPCNFVADLSRPAVPQPAEQHRRAHQQPPLQDDEQEKLLPKEGARQSVLLEGQAGVVKVGPWGGKGGSLRDVGSASRLRSIRIRHADVITGLRIFYMTGGTLFDFVIGAAGGSGWSESKIDLAPGEHLTSMSGSIRNYGGITCVGRLSFATNTGATYGPYGGGGGTPFSLPIAEGRIVNVFGRGGIYVDAIGVYLAP